jgi:hypothetical protein
MRHNKVVACPQEVITGDAIIDSKHIPHSLFQQCEKLATRSIALMQT